MGDQETEAQPVIVVVDDTRELGALVEGLGVGLDVWVSGSERELRRWFEHTAPAMLMVNLDLHSHVGLKAMTRVHNSYRGTPVLGVSAHAWVQEMLSIPCVPRAADEADLADAVGDALASAGQSNVARDLLVLYLVHGKTGSLYWTMDGEEASLYLSEGFITSARVGDALEGEEALKALLQWTRPELSVMLAEPRPESNLKLDVLGLVELPWDPSERALLEGDGEGGLLARASWVSPDQIPTGRYLVQPGGGPESSGVALSLLREEAITIDGEEGADALEEEAITIDGDEAADDLLDATFTAPLTEAPVVATHRASDAVHSEPTRPVGLRAAPRSESTRPVELRAAPHEPSGGGESLFDAELEAIFDQVTATALGDAMGEELGVGLMTPEPAMTPDPQPSAASHAVAVGGVPSSDEVMLVLSSTDDESDDEDKLKVGDATLDQALQLLDDIASEEAQSSSGLEAAAIGPGPMSFDRVRVEILGAMTPLTVLSGFHGCMMVSPKGPEVVASHGFIGESLGGLARMVVHAWSEARQSAEALFEEILVETDTSQVHLIRPLSGGRLYYLNLHRAKMGNLSFARRALSDVQDPLNASRIARSE